MPETILGLPGAVFLLWLSAAFYLVALILFWEPFRRERTDLMVAFCAFLAGMTAFHILLGAGFYLNNLLLIHLGSFAALTASAYTSKFLLSRINQPGRQLGFYLLLLIAWAIVAWMLIFPHQTQAMLLSVFLYMIVVTGGSGLFIVWKGFQAKEGWAKIKLVGGGIGLITCCLVADVFVLFAGVTILGEIFMSLAPIILVTAVLLGRYLQKKQEKIPSGAITI